MLDVALYEEQQLTTADGDTYPLVIRMETITDKGKADGHTLQVPALPHSPHVIQTQRAARKLSPGLYMLPL